jgi:ubiquinone/menaquinone biosynthesis C-methylase UbiE
MSRRETYPAEPSIVARVRPGLVPVAPTHDDEVYPLYAGRFAELLLQAIGPRISGSVLELGCRRGEITRQLLARRGDQGLIVAMEGSPGRLSLARSSLLDFTRSGQVFLRAHDPAQRLPFADEMYDLVVSNLVLGEVPDRRAVLADLARVARPGARIAVTLPLDGTFAEVIDLFDEVLVGLRHDEARAALGTYRMGLPLGETVARELEALGFEEVEVKVARWELLFGSSREFFYAPLIEQGPLPRWKAIAGRGEKMHRVFLTLKESIDRYYAGRPFAVTVLAGCVHGHRPAQAA